MNLIAFSIIFLLLILIISNIAILKTIVNLQTCIATLLNEGNKDRINIFKHQEQMKCLTNSKYAACLQKSSYLSKLDKTNYANKISKEIKNKYFKNN